MMSGRAAGSLPIWVAATMPPPNATHMIGHCVFSSGKGTDIRKLSPVRLDPSIPVSDDAKTNLGELRIWGRSPRRGQGHLPIFV